MNHFLFLVICILFNDVRRSGFTILIRMKKTKQGLKKIEETHVKSWMYLWAVLRGRDVNPGSDFSHLGSRIQGWQDSGPGSGSVSKNLSIFNPENWNQVLKNKIRGVHPRSWIWIFFSSRIRIPDPEIGNTASSVNLFYFGHNKRISSKTAGDPVSFSLDPSERYPGTGISSFSSSFD